MTRTAFPTLAAALLAASLGIAALTTPAAANSGSFTYTMVPQNAKEERALRLALTAVAISNGARTKGATIKQLGSRNLAGIAQQGTNNLGVVHQQGTGHEATLTQNGDNNAYGLFQIGKNTSSHVVQNGNGGAGLTVQFGW